MALTPQEREILASIENQMSQKDRRLAARLNNLPMTSPGNRTPLPARHVLVLIAALAAIAALNPIISQQGVLAVAACVAALIVPWLVSASRAMRTRASAADERQEDPPDGSTEGTTGQEPAVNP